ncbi:30S ribosomal protein S16 [Flavimarina sp. Hel_I_48]|uniref:30S ribosomal protein S16 n=1 Tax=Flavimarina sp. Hel_I_48 TaxID=1392488 RepID=UPI0004DF1F95|nr:30S ribosomal protein S16 [Flavimarina sp. Hel_I_48]
MPVKIRLQRHGKKGKPFFWVVAADARSKRDGKFLEKLGTYNPTANPAIIDLDVDASVKWLQNGAQPSETAKRLLSYKGALLKNHLAGGVRKGAITEEQMEEKFNAWLEEKGGKIDSKKENLTKEQEKAKKEALEAEKAVNDARIAANQPEPEPEAAAEGQDDAPADAENTEAKEAPEEEKAPATEQETKEEETK